MERLHKILYSLQGQHKKNLGHICSNGFPFRYRTASFGLRRGEPNPRRFSAADLRPCGVIALDNTPCILCGRFLA